MSEASALVFLLLHDYSPGEGREWEMIYFIENYPKNKKLCLHNNLTQNYRIKLFWGIRLD